MTDILKPNQIGGFDLSVYEDDPTTPRGIDWQKAANAGIKFMWARASIGLGKDADYPTFMSGSKSLMPRGAYHFLFPSTVGTVHYSIMQQAQIFHDCIVGDLPEMPPCLDAEYDDGKNKLSKSDVYGWLTYIHQLFNPWPWKHDILIYTGFYYWRDVIGWTDASALAYDLWLADYNQTENLMPAPWSKSLFCQFSDNGDGTTYGTESLSVDLDEWTDTPDAFSQYTGFSQPTPIPPVVTPSVLPMDIHIAADGTVTKVTQ